MCQAVLTVLTGLTLRLSEAQVNHQIYSKTDLMATDSLRSGLGVTVRPPPGFLSNQAAAGTGRRGGAPQPSHADAGTDIEGGTLVPAGQALGP